jgi:hypothetical protein
MRALCGEIDIFDEYLRTLSTEECREDVTWKLILWCCLCHITVAAPKCFDVHYWSKRTME